jgi:nucleoside-diphosphate-sugar epimerase
VRIGALKELVAGVQTQKIIFCSSVAAFGRSLPDGTYSETSPVSRDSDYAADKIDAAEFLRQSTTSAQVTILHPTIVYARRSDRVIFYEAALRVSYFQYRKDGSGTYNVVHADDLAEAIFLSLNRVNGDRVENYIVNGEAISFSKWISAIELMCGYDRAPRLPQSLAPIARGPVRKLLRLFGVRVPTKLPEFKAIAFETKISFDISKIVRDLNWVPKRNVSEVFERVR